jgi:hypothetical protein
VSDTTGSSTPEAPSIRVITRSVTPEELAAVTAVVQAAVADELESLHAGVHIGPSAWERSQRTLRTPLHPAPGAWRGFSA